MPAGVIRVNEPCGVPAHLTNIAVIEYVDDGAAARSSLMQGACLGTITPVPLPVRGQVAAALPRQLPRLQLKLARAAKFQIAGCGLRVAGSGGRVQGARRPLSPRVVSRAAHMVYRAPSRACRVSL